MFGSNASSGLCWAAAEGEEEDAEAGAKSPALVAPSSLGPSSGVTGVGGSEGFEVVVEMIGTAKVTRAPTTFFGAGRTAAALSRDNELPCVDVARTGVASTTGDPDLAISDA